MDGRDLLRQRADQYDFDPSEIELEDEDVLQRLEPVVRDWWVDQFGKYADQNNGFFTPPQREAIPNIDDKNNTLVASPTGSGKTLASFTEIINELYREDRENGLKNSVYALYVSPLKSLANDIHRNLEVPLQGISERADGDINIRHAIRHGDTPDSKRSEMLETTPHILNTTPETLAILLNSPKFKKKLETVEYVIVDEIHSIAESKRGTHLTVSLERLEDITETSPTRIGCSATVEPLEEVGRFLVGMEDPSEQEFRDFEIVDTRFVRDYDIKVEAPTDDLIYTDQSTITQRFYDRLHTLIQQHTNTLIFTNTRSGAERVLNNLQSSYPDTYTEENSGTHHGSLSSGERERIEEKLRDGEIDVVTTSTSLELGIDMPDIDLVVQVGSPKSVSSLLQRIGRAGHRLGQTVVGRILVLDRDELVECSVMAERAEDGFIDRVFIPENAQDVAAQHVYGIAIDSVRPEERVKEILRSSYPYRNYTDDEWEELMRYLTADYDGLEDKNVYAKIWRDTNDPQDGEHHYDEYEVGERLIGKRGRMARVIYMTNIGTIPDSFTCQVQTRSDGEWVGELDEEYLNTLDKGDVFRLGGANYEYQYRRGSKVYVDQTSKTPTVPSWFSERLPLSYDLSREILEFHDEFIDHLTSGENPMAFFDGWPIDDNSARALVRMYEEQIDFLGADSISTPTNLVVEEHVDRDEYQRNYYIHSLYGRRFNDGFSRLVAYRVSQETNANVSVAVSDHGFTLSMPLNRKVDMDRIIENIDVDDVEADLRASLDSTDLLKRYFRINATRSLMILKRYKGNEKSAKQQQVRSDQLLNFSENLGGFAVVEETYREIMEDKLAIDAIEEVVGQMNDGELSVTVYDVSTPSPRAFGLATLMASDTVLAEDQSAVLKGFHERVTEVIEEQQNA